MACLYPVEIHVLFKSLRDSGLTVVYHDLRQIPPKHRDKYYPTVRPCQTCIECKLRKSTETAILCTHTASMYQNNAFLTLTYSDDYLPADLSLDTDEIQRFWKRLRKKISPLEIKHYSSGEYGDGGGRRPINPHYHACLFGYDLPDKKYYKSNDRGDRLYTSELLTNTWGKGHCVIGDLTFESAAYVARYTIKKIYGDEAPDHYGGRLPEKSWSSNHLGVDWFHKFYRDVYPDDKVTLRDGRTFAPPTKYDELLALTDPELWQQVSDNRSSKQIINKNNNVLERYWEHDKPVTRSASDVVRRAKLRVGKLDNER